MYTIDFVYSKINVKLIVSSACYMSILSRTLAKHSCKVNFNLLLLHNIIFPPRRTVELFLIIWCLGCHQHMESYECLQLSCS